jgi:uncharacterized protein YbcV (DUF1398 family)
MAEPDTFIGLDSSSKRFEGKQSHMPTFDKNRIEEVFTKSKQERWPYPKVFKALKEAGVEFYETDVATHNIMYLGSGDTCAEPPPAGFVSLMPNPQFEPTGVQLAIKRNQSQQTIYPVFLEEIARAGVRKYRVDMYAGTVTYIGVAGQEYVEKVLQF